MLVKAGYDETTAEATPGRVMNQQGVQEALKEKGFTVEAADDLVQSILNKTTAADKDRLKAADMMYDRLGAKAPQKSISLTLSADIEDFKQYEELSLKYDEDMKRKMLSENL